MAVRLTQLPDPTQRLIGSGNVIDQVWFEWVRSVDRALRESQAAITTIQNIAPYAPEYEVADAPTTYTAGQIIYVPDEAGGPTLAVSDGTNWLRASDGAVIS